MSVVAGTEADPTTQNETTEEINVLLVCIGNFKHNMSSGVLVQRGWQ